jgi:hypothetical protein
VAARFFFALEIPANTGFASADFAVPAGKVTSFAAFAGANGAPATGVDTVITGATLAVRGSETGSIDALVESPGAVRILALRKQAIGPVRVVVALTID